MIAHINHFSNGLRNAPVLIAIEDILKWDCTSDNTLILWERNITTIFPPGMWQSFSITEEETEEETEEDEELGKR